jgi:hypothetical protein
MRVIDDDQRLIRFAETLHAPGRRAQPRHRGQRIVERHATLQQHTQHTQRFAALKAPKSRVCTSPLPQGVATDSTMPCAFVWSALAVTSPPAKPYVNTLRRASRAASTRLWPNGSSTLITLRESPGQAKELRLRGAVRRHRLVIIEMVAREVREQRNVERNGIDPALIETMRRNFHRHHLCAGRLEAREQLVHTGRVGGRVLRRLQCIDETVAQRAEHRGAASGHLETVRDPVRTRCLAVGAGDADHPQRLRRVSEDGVGDRAQFRLQVIDRLMRGAPLIAPVESRWLEQHRCSTARDRVGDECAAIERFTRKCGEGVALRNAATVGDDAFGCGTERCQQRRNIHFRSDEGGHVSSPISAMSAGRITLSTGASVGTPSIRSAEPITVENTGAATAPP